MSWIVSLFKPLAYLSLPVLFLRSIAGTSPLARYYVKAFAYAGTLASVASGCVFAAIGYSVAGCKYDLNHFVARVFYMTVNRLFNLEVEVEGEEYLDRRPAVLMCNHQSMLDILIIGRLMPKQATIVSKDSLKYSPLGPFMIMSGSIFINRGNNAAAVASLNAAGNLIKKDKISTWIFPEGTRHLSSESNMLPLKKGGFHLAVSAGIPIIPIVVENYYHIYHKGVFNEGKIRVKVLPPIQTVGLTGKDVSELAVRVREQMVSVLHDISTHAIRPSNEKQAESDHAAEIQAQKPIVEEKVPASPAPSSTSQASGQGLFVSDSTVSLASSISTRRSRSSDNGADTEEDEGMVLVGKPDN